MVDLEVLLKEPAVTQIAGRCDPPISRGAVYKWRREGKIPSDRLRVVAEVTGTPITELVESFMPAGKAA